ncbi:MAG: hypothetical protein SGJ18_07015, partial [Pseudomonadota bacterium]|nr:hypothetical protein [Pseudomonadota bacterium]
MYPQIPNIDILILRQSPKVTQAVTLAYRYLILQTQCRTLRCILEIVIFYCSPVNIVNKYGIALIAVTLQRFCPPLILQGFCPLYVSFWYAFPRISASG